MLQALVVENEIKDAQHYRAICESEGFATTVLRDGAAAVEFLQRQPPLALAIINVSLPGVDGFSVVKALRGQRHGGQVPVLMSATPRHLRDVAMQQRQTLGLMGVIFHGMLQDSLVRAVKRALAGVQTPPPNTAADDEARLSKEAARLRTVEALHLHDDGPQGARLQSVLQDVAHRFHVSTAAITLVQKDRQWFKAHVGLRGALLNDRGSPLEQSFCRHVTETDLPLIVPDAAVHPAFFNNPLVTGGVVRSYAGVPLSKDGQSLGTLCIMDSKPMAFSAQEVDQLVGLARQLVGDFSLKPQEPRTDSNAAPFSKEELLHVVLDNLDTRIVLSDMERRVLYVNRCAMERMPNVQSAPTSLTRDQVLRLQLAHADNAAPLDDLLRVAPMGPFAARGEFSEAPGHKWTHWVAKPVQMRGRTLQLETLTDVTAEVEARMAREALAYTDALTGLANRRAGEEALTREVERARRGGRPLSVVMMDVDWFKSVNDQHGHQVGDDVLRMVAACVVAQVRGMDAAVRFGGEEFLAILPDADGVAAKVVAERIRKSVQATALAGLPQVTLSAGVGQFGAGETNGTAMLKRADEALYRAKAAGRNAVC